MKWHLSARVRGDVNGEQTWRDILGIEVDEDRRWRTNLVYGVAHFGGSDSSLEIGR